jgi:hypothetical protein
LTGPPITSWTVFTTVPCAARGASQSSSALKSAGRMSPLLLQASQTRWMRICAQPPYVSAVMMAFSMSVSVWSPPNATIVVAYGSLGGIDSVHGFSQSAPFQSTERALL